MIIMLITTRKQTKKVMIGNIQLGHCNHVVIQSMTNTKTSDVTKTLLQIRQLVGLGCELVRVAILDKEDALALRTLVKQAPCPLIADIHYNYAFAVKAIEAGVAKIRINPHNIKKQDDLKKIVDCAKKHNTAIRIGVNQGSILDVKKHKASDLVNEAVKYVKLFEA
jgi:(E)-4-hydroxy-3-methylbut-2-enyl-diphosphate synthase